MKEWKTRQEIQRNFLEINVSSYTPAFKIVYSYDSKRSKKFKKNETIGKN